MKIERIESILAVGRNKTARLHMSIFPERTLFVRTVSILSPSTIIIDYDPYYDYQGDGHYKYKIDSLGECFMILEAYLGVKITDLKEPEYPEIPVELDPIITFEDVCNLFNKDLRRLEEICDSIRNK